MKQQRSIAVKGKTAVLVCGLAAVGLLIPASADARPRPSAWGSAGGSFAPRETRSHDMSGRAGRKTRHHKKTGASAVSEAGSRRKRRSPRAAEARQARLACTDAFNKAKEAAQDNHLRAANEWFALCAERTCAGSMRKRCAVVHTKIAAMLPSVVPEVTDATGASISEAEVSMDGEILTSRLDGSAIVIDPGEHKFTFAKDGEVFATRNLSIEKGQRRQIVSATYQPPKPESLDPEPAPVVERRRERPAPRKVPAAVAIADTESGEAAAGQEQEAAPRLVRREPARRASAEAETQTGAPWSAYALAGVGLLGVGGYATFNLKGSADNDALVAFCKPDCKPESVRHVRNLYLAADVSLGIGIAALAASTYLFFRSNGAEEEEAPTRSRISRLGVAPTSAGALATVGGTF